MITVLNHLLLDYLFAYLAILLYHPVEFPCLRRQDGAFLIFLLEMRLSDRLLKKLGVQIQEFD